MCQITILAVSQDAKNAAQKNKNAAHAQEIQKVAAGIVKKAAALSQNVVQNLSAALSQNAVQMMATTVKDLKERADLLEDSNRCRRLVLQATTSQAEELIVKIDKKFSLAEISGG